MIVTDWVVRTLDWLDMIITEIILWDETTPRPIAVSPCGAR